MLLVGKGAPAFLKTLGDFVNGKHSATNQDSCFDETHDECERDINDS